MSNRVIPYQSGFVGFIKEHNKHHIDLNYNELDLNAVLHAAKYNTGVNTSGDNNGLAFSTTVDRLYNLMQENTNIFKDNNFKQEVLITALKIFGTNSFYEWVNTQTKTNTFNIMHKEFLLDTLQYIAGNQRRVNIMSWKTLITYAEQTAADKKAEFDPNNFFSYNIKITNPYLNTSDDYETKSRDLVYDNWMTNNYSQQNQISDKLTFAEMTKGRALVENVVIEWVRKFDGYRDLLTSLNIIFGKN